MIDIDMAVAAHCEWKTTIAECGQRLIFRQDNIHRARGTSGHPRQRFMAFGLGSGAFGSGVFNLKLDTRDTLTFAGRDQHVHDGLAAVAIDRGFHGRIIIALGFQHGTEAAFVLRRAAAQGC